MPAFFGHSVIYWILVAFTAVVIFLLARELIPLLFGIVEWRPSAMLTKLLSLLIAVGFLWYAGVRAG